MKLYCRQIDPEFQTAPLMYGDFPINCAVFGNRGLRSHFPEWAKDIPEQIRSGELRYRLELCDTPEERRMEVEDFFPPRNREHYTDDEVEKFWECLEGSSPYQISWLLSIIDGCDWEYRQTTGCVQRDWQTFYYPVEVWSADEISIFETEYFNTGTEWMCCESEDEPDDPGNISGCGFYTHGWNEDQWRREIAEAFCYKPEDVVLYAIEEIHTVKKYTYSRVG